MSVSLLGAAAAATVTVEMVADVVCPYCYIGLSRLNQALEELAESAQAVEVLYTPFILRRHLPKEGVPKREVFISQFGSENGAEHIFAQVKATAMNDGLCFDSTGQRAGNSEDAHRLLLWATPPHRFALFESMMKIYNCERGWLGDHETLLRAVQRVHGLDIDIARSVLADPSAHAAELEAGLRRSEVLHVRGVPSFFVDGRPLGAGAPSAQMLRDAINMSCASNTALSSTSDAI
jgi:predicted DsbA family dithiol-disulfide isomerase